MAGALFLIINLLAGVYAVRHWRRLFGPDPQVGGDIAAVRQLQIIVIVIPWLFLTMRLLVEWVKLWIQ
jgi:ABC-type transport system involved in cytochrome c biogenesis permease subunit